MERELQITWCEDGLAHMAGHVPVSAVPAILRAIGAALDAKPAKLEPPAIDETHIAAAVEIITAAWVTGAALNQNPRSGRRYAAPILSRRLSIPLDVARALMREIERRGLVERYLMDSYTRKRGLRPASLGDVFA